MGNFNYGKTLQLWDERLSYDKDEIVNLLKKNYDEIKDMATSGGYFNYVDSLLLLSMLKEFNPMNIVEIGGGGTTKMIISYINKYQPDIHLSTFAIEIMHTLGSISEPINFKFIKGDFLNTYFENEIDWESVDLLFIDGLHEAHFATFYCHEIFPKLKKGTLIHIHDVQEPSILLDGYQKGYLKLGEYWKNPAITDEAYEIYYFIKDKPEYKILCNSNNLIEYHSDLVRWIPNAEGNKYINVLPGAPAESLWIRKT